LALTGIITGIYFACFYSSTKKVNVTGVSDPTLSSSNINITAGDTTYTLNDPTNSKNSWAEIYYNAQDGAHYNVYVKASNGNTISFPVVVYTYSETFHRITIGSFLVPADTTTPTVSNFTSDIYNF
jgi:hypothetical protein